MENLTISSKVDNTFDFDITAQGLNVKSGQVLLNVEVTKHLSYSIHCKNVAGQKWTMTIPKETFENGTHKYKICVIVDDFYFEPIKGELVVVSKDTIKVGSSDNKDSKEKEKSKKSDPKNDKKAVKEDITPKTDNKDNIEEPKEIKETQTEDEIHIQETVNPTAAPQYQFFKTDHPYESMDDNGEKDRKVRQIIQEMGGNKDKQTSPQKSSIRKKGVRSL